MLLKVSASDADLHLSRSLFEPLPTSKAVTLSFCLRLNPSVMVPVVDILGTAPLSRADSRAMNND